MSGLIPESFIETLLERVDIADVVGQRVPLKPAGHEFKACCPFHDEKTPSFYVSPQKQFYHCFGCGAHGTAIGFVMQYDGLEFPPPLRNWRRTPGWKYRGPKALRARIRPKSGSAKRFTRRWTRPRTSSATAFGNPRPPAPTSDSAASMTAPSMNSVSAWLRMNGQRSPTACWSRDSSPRYWSRPACRRERATTT